MGGGNCEKVCIFAQIFITLSLINQFYHYEEEKFLYGTRFGSGFNVCL